MKLTQALELLPPPAHIGVRVNEMEGDSPPPHICVGPRGSGSDSSAAGSTGGLLAGRGHMLVSGLLNYVATV